MHDVTADPSSLDQPLVLWWNTCLVLACAAKHLMLNDMWHGFLGCQNQACAVMDIWIRLHDFAWSVRGCTKRGKMVWCKLIPIGALSLLLFSNCWCELQSVAKHVESAPHDKQGLIECIWECFIRYLMMTRLIPTNWAPCNLENSPQQPYPKRFNQFHPASPSFCQVHPTLSHLSLSTFWHFWCNLQPEIH